MISSLRARLLAGLLALTAAGMLIAGGVTYAEQRSFLYERVDEQTRDAPFVLGRALDGEHDAGPRPGGPGDGDGPLGPPAGTYGELRTASSSTRSVTLPVGQGITAKPDLPERVPLGRLFTVSGDDGRYRVLAQRDLRTGGTLIAAVPLREADEQLDRLLAVEALVIGVVLALLGIAGWAVVRIGLLPLDRMGHTAGQIAGGGLSHRVEATDPRTEVPARARAQPDARPARGGFTRRKESEDRLRTFIADASHELRTPLASIRGYAELFRMGAVPEGLERERAMRRIEDEAARMGVLVEDLLTLARLDEIADAPHTELDVATLAGDAVDDARATAPDREIGLDARPAAVRGDAHQLRQVLGNLLRNALVHTPAGTPIEVTVEPEPEVVRVSVRDHRPGLPTDDPDCSPRSPPPARRARSTPRSWCPSSTSRPRSSAACAGDNSILRTVLRAAREDRAHRARRPARRGAAGQAGANAAALAITAIADTAANRRLTGRIRGRRDVVRLSADVAADDRLRADGVVDGRRGGRGLREPLLEHGLQRKERVAVEP